MLISGSFRQILLVIGDDSKGQIVSPTLKWSALYGGSERLRLTEKMRLSALREDRKADRAALEFLMYCLRVREGIIDDRQGHGIIDFHITSSVVPVSSIDNLISFVYEETGENHRESNRLTSRAKLCVKNAGLLQMKEIVGENISDEYFQFTT